MKPAASDIYPVIDTWPLRLGRNFQQSFDTSGSQIWTDRLTHALLTAALLFPLHSTPGRGKKYSRNKIMALYLYQQTGILRTPKQCHSKLRNLFMHEEIKSAVENYQPAPDASKRDELLVHLRPLVPSYRSAQAERLPTPPLRKGAPYSRPDFIIRTSSSATSPSYSLLGYAAALTIISGAVALELSDLVPHTPVPKAHVVPPPNPKVESSGGIQIELVVPGTNSIKCPTCSVFTSLRDVERGQFFGIGPYCAKMHRGLRHLSDQIENRERRNQVGGASQSFPECSNQAREVWLGVWWRATQVNNSLVGSIVA